MITIETRTNKEQITEMTEMIHRFEIELMKNKHTRSFEEIEEAVDAFMEFSFEMEQQVNIDKETLFYARLLRAKVEEILDIIELKRAM